MKTYVKKDICIGCGACTVIADEIFEIGDDGLAETKPELRNKDERNDHIEVKKELQDGVRDAAESCPVDAIEVEE